MTEAQEEHEEPSDYEGSAASSGSTEVADEMIVSAWEEGYDARDVDARAPWSEGLDFIDGLAGVACVPRPSVSHRQVLVHERDAHDFWNLRRWALVPSLLLYRYAATEDACPAGLCNLERCETELDGLEQLRLWMPEGGVVEARFRDTDARAAWHEQVRAASPEAVATELEAVRVDLLKAHEEIVRLRKEAAVATEAALQAEHRLRTAELAAGCSLDALADALAAERASSSALLANTAAAASSTAQGFLRENAALRTKVATLEADLTEARADKAHRNLIDREARKKSNAERKLLVREIKHLRKCLRQGVTAKDAADKVVQFWDRDEEDDAPHQENNAPTWLIDEIIRLCPEEDEEDDSGEIDADTKNKRPIQNDVVVVAGRDLNSGDIFGLTPEQVAFKRRVARDATSRGGVSGGELTPQQLAFTQQNQQYYATRKNLTASVVRLVQFDHILMTFAFTQATVTSAFRDLHSRIYK